MTLPEPFYIMDPSNLNYYNTPYVFSVFRNFICLIVPRFL